MKYFFLLLFLSMSMLAQNKTQGGRYQIIDCKPINETATVFLLDTETGRTWRLCGDTLFFSWDKSQTIVSGHRSLKNYWQEVPFELPPDFEITSKEQIDFPSDENIRYFKQPSEEPKAKK
ncbi:MAG: hypothetical protein WBZ48_00315 [Bacteroidota bacterium]